MRIRHLQINTQILLDLIKANLVEVDPEMYGNYVNEVIELFNHEMYVFNVVMSRDSITLEIATDEPKYPYAGNACIFVDKQVGL